MWEQSRQYETFLGIQLLNIKLLAIFQDQPNVSAIQGQPLIDGLLNGVLLCLCEVLKPPYLAVVSWEVLEGIPVAILDRLDAAVLDESLAGLFVQWRVHLVREVHVLTRSSLQLGKFLMFLRYFIRVLHIRLVQIKFLIIFIIVL